MEKWRKKAKKPPKGDPVDVKSHLYGEIEVSSYSAFFSISESTSKKYQNKVGMLEEHITHTLDP